MVYKDNFKKVIYSLQYIRDLYDKMFPSAKDYIKFLRERINTLDNEEHNVNPHEDFKEIKRFIPPRLFHPEERNEKSFDFLFEKDHWKDLSQRDIILYKYFTEQWLKTKTRRQRRIWNYFVLGVPKNTIAPKLKENTNFVARTINTLQNDFLDLILNIKP